MKAQDLMELTARNLRGSLLRNMLTTVGIAVGVASLVSMLSLGVGLQTVASRRLMKSGLFDIILVTPRGMGPNAVGGKAAKQEQPAAEPVPLDEAARGKIAAINGVVEAVPDVRFTAELKYTGKPRRTPVAGISAMSRRNDSFESVRGAFFSSQQAAEAILQKAFAADLLGKPHETAVDALAGELVGKQLELAYAERSTVENADFMGLNIVVRKKPVKVVGIVDLDPESMRGPMRARVFVPLEFAQSINAMQMADMRDGLHATSAKPTFTALNVRVSNPSQVSRVEDEIKKMGYGAFSILDATRSLQQVFGIFDLFLGAFGSLALAVASIGIVNTLVMAILERRREIGIMKAIGASDRDVRTIFFAEAGAMGLVGGLLGVALGWAIGRAINFGTDMYLTRQGLPTEQIWMVPWWLVASAIAFAVLVSLVSGWYPASRAARLDPVDALRYE